MKRNQAGTGIMLLIIIMFSSCCRKHQESVKGPEAGGVKQAGPPVYIYKTKGDYARHVPVILSPDKTKVLSFPATTDLTYRGQFSYPTPLSDGYLLDNRGIGPDAAFLTYTYEEYAALPATPGPEELLSKILDKDPFTALYHCGSRYGFKDAETELNAAIEAGKLDVFRKLK